MPAFSKVIGKVRGALLKRNVQRVMFTTLSVALKNLPMMRQYQVIQHSVEDIVVSDVADQNLDEFIVQAFEEDFGYRPRGLRAQRVQLIERGANGKFYASICHC